MRHREGFTLIEVLVAAFLLSVAAVAVTGLIVLSSRLAFESERSAVAQGIVNQWIEYIRSLDYDDVRVDESSVLLPSQTVIANGQEYELLFVVELKDDPANGLLASLDQTNADYKQVYVTAQWETAGQTERSVKSSTIITRLSNPISCTPGNTSCPGPGGANTVLCPASGYCPAIQYCAVGEYQCFGGTVLCPASGICPGSPPASDSCPAGAYFCSATSDQGLVLSEFFPDPGGADDTGEFIEIENPQDGPVDISGWKIDDGPGGSDPYVIPPGTTIDPGEFVTFDQTETGIELDNDEDSVRIFDEYWNQVEEVSYIDPVEGQSYTQIDDAGSGDGGAGGGGGSTGGGTGGGSYVWYPPTPGLPGPVWCPTSDDYYGSDDYC